MSLITSFTLKVLPTTLQQCIGIANRPQDDTIIFQCQVTPPMNTVVQMALNGTILKTVQWNAPIGTSPADVIYHLIVDEIDGST